MKFLLRLFWSASIILGLFPALAHSNLLEPQFFIQTKPDTTEPFVSPYGIAVDKAGFVWIADTGNSRILKMLPKGGTFVTVQELKAPETIDGLDRPQGLDVDRFSRVWITDTANHRIVVFDPSKPQGQQWFTLGDCEASGCLFYLPRDIVIDHGAGVVYVSDTGNNRIRRYSLYITKLVPSNFPGKNTNELIGFSDPYGITVKSGRLYVADTSNQQVKCFSTSGDLLWTYGEEGTRPGHFLFPLDVTVDNMGNIYVVDESNSRIQKFAPRPVSSTGPQVLLAVFGEWSREAGGMFRPKKAAVSQDGKLIYIIDSDLNRLQGFDTSKIQDRTPPMLDSVVPMDGRFVKGTMNSIDAEVYDDAVGIDLNTKKSRMVVTKNGKPVLGTLDNQPVSTGVPVLTQAKMKYTFSPSLGPAVSDDATYTVDITAVDKGGYSATFETEFTLDNTVPDLPSLNATPVYFSPHASPGVTDITEIAGNITETNLDVWELKIQHTQQNFMRTFQGFNNEISNEWDGTDGSIENEVHFPEGEYDAMVEMEDLAGNKQTIRKSHFIVIDNTEPVAEITFPGISPNAKPLMLSGAKMLTVTGTAYDVNLEEYTLELAPGVEPYEGFETIEKKTQRVSNGNLGMIDLSTFSPGTYTLRLMVRDKAEHEVEILRTFSIVK